MHRLFKVAAALVCAVGLPALASTTSVTATLTDSDSTAWATCKWTAVVSSPVPPTISRTPVPDTSLRANGTCDASGVLTSTMLNTSSVDQAGVTWTFTIQPNASVSPSVVSGVAVTGSSINLSATLSAGIKAPRFGAGTDSYGYADVEVNSPTLGDSYYNVITPCYRQFSNAGWACGGGGGGGASPAGVNVLQASNAAGSALAQASTSNGLSLIKSGSTYSLNPTGATSWESLNSRLVPLLPTGQQPTVSYNAWVLQQTANLVLPTQGCTGAVAATNNGCFFPYPFGSFTQGGSFPANFFWTLDNMIHCFPTSPTTAANPTYYVPVVSQGQFLDVKTLGNGSTWNVQVNGQWLYPGLGVAVPSDSNLKSIHIDFGSSAYRRILFQFNGGFRFGGIAPGGSSDLIQATSTTFPMGPLLVVASDSTGQGVYEPGQNGESWPYTLAKMVNSPVLNFSCGGTGYLANNSGVNGTQSFSVDYPTLVTALTATGQTTGMLLIGHGINDGAVAGLQAAVTTTLSGLASGLPGWQLGIVGPWSPGTPTSGGNLTAQTAIYAAAAAASPVVPVLADMIDEQWVTGVWSAASCTTPTLKPQASTAAGNACTMMVDSSPHPSATGANMAASRMFADVFNSYQGFPNYGTNNLTPVVPAYPSNTLPYILPGTIYYPVAGVMQGTVSWPNSSKIVTGVGTQFTKQAAPGNSYTMGSLVGVIASIQSDTQMTTVSVNSSGALSNVAWDLAGTPNPAFEIGLNGVLPFTPDEALSNHPPCATDGYVRTYSLSTNTWPCSAPASGASLSTANNWTTNGAASAPAQTYSGTPASGSGTTAIPFFYFSPTGTTAVTSWGTNGTVEGMNFPVTYTGNIQDFVRNGSHLWIMDQNGSVTSGGSFQGTGINISNTAGGLKFNSGASFDAGLYRCGAACVQFGGTSTGATGTAKATLVQLVTGVAPTCSSTTQGTFQYTAGGAGVKDIVQVCAKDASDVFAYRTIY